MEMGSQEALQEHRLRARFPHRVALLVTGGARQETERVTEVRRWCVERYRTGAVDEEFEPLYQPDTCWWYRFEYGSADLLGFSTIYHAFYFRKENDALEFKMRWV